MRDNEIIKALECCKNDDCDNCPNTFGNCYANLAGYALALINRQQAEIERLKKTNPLFEYATKSVHQYIEDGQTYYLDFVNEEREAEAISKKIDYLCNIQDIRAEANKEFAEKLKEKAVDVGICDAQGNSFGGATVVFVGDIDNLVKEMVGADNV